MIAGSLAVDALAVAVALLAGYLVGSIPLAGLVARSAERAGAGRPGSPAVGRNPGPADVWALAGPGWGLLAVVGDLAKGVLPVAIGIVTWSWGVGWAAGLGAVLGASWPAFGRLPGRQPAAVLAGAAFALAPPAGMVSATVALIFLGIGRLLGRDARVTAVSAGFLTFPLLFLAVEQDLVRLCGLLVLYLVAGVRFLATRGRRNGDHGHSPSALPRETLGATPEDTDAARPLAP